MAEPGTDVAEPAEEGIGVAEPGTDVAEPAEEGSGVAESMVVVVVVVCVCVCVCVCHLFNLFFSLFYLYQGTEPTERECIDVSTGLLPIQSSTEQPETHSKL